MGPLILGKSRLVKYHYSIWPDVYLLYSTNQALSMTAITIAEIIIVAYTYILGTQMTFIFEDQPPPKQGLFQSKQGSFGFQVYILGIWVWPPPSNSGKRRFIGIPTKNLKRYNCTVAQFNSGHWFFFLRSTRFRSRVWGGTAGHCARRVFCPGNDLNLSWW